MNNQEIIRLGRKLATLEKHRAKALEKLNTIIAEVSETRGQLASELGFNPAESIARAPKPNTAQSTLLELLKGGDYRASELALKIGKPCNVTNGLLSSLENRGKVWRPSRGVWALRNGDK